jgi:hypothetical protein
MEVGMRMPNDDQSHPERFSDCQKAILPLVASALRSSPSGICDAETILHEILPEAKAAGWQEEDVICVLRSMDKAASEQAKHLGIPVPPSDQQPSPT